jgi:hypothetical protein
MVKLNRQNNKKQRFAAQEEEEMDLMKYNDSNECLRCPTEGHDNGRCPFNIRQKNTYLVESISRSM